MNNLLIPKYKLQFFIFEKSGSRAIIHSLKKLFDFTEDNNVLTTEDFRDLEVQWPRGYTRVLIYRNVYKRLVSGWYTKINNVLKHRNKKNLHDDDWYDDNNLRPKTKDFEEHRVCFQNFCKEFFVYNEYNPYTDISVFPRVDAHLQNLQVQIGKEYQDKIDYKVNLENLIDEIELIMTKVGISKTDSSKFIESLKVEKQIMKEQKSKMIEKNKYDLVKEYRATRVTDDYYSYYNKISDDTLKSVNEYYNGDFDYLGMKRL